MRTNWLGMEFRLIPAGEFVMGSDAGDEDERPLHRVRITQPFYLGRTEVTQQQWDAVMPYHRSYVTGPPDLPVDMVTWNDANSFCKRLSELDTENDYRLPSEAEWEYACRAGTTTEHYGRVDRIAWYRENSATTTHPVASLEPNAWGLFDMSGNVWEWCQDWYEADYYKKSPEADPPGAATGDCRVVRGGAEYTDAKSCRSAERAGMPPNQAGGIVNGFRVVMIPRKGN